TGAIVTQVIAGFPGETNSTLTVPVPFSGTSHYKHIAGTPPVNLEPSSTDTNFFLGLKYATADATASPDGLFTATTRGKAVLLFCQSINPAVAAVGDTTKEKLFVRVVETRTWTDGTGWPNQSSPLLKDNSISQEIGQPLQTAYDTAGLGTGYLISEKGNTI